MRTSPKTTSHVVNMDRVGWVFAWRPTVKLKLTYGYVDLEGESLHGFHRLLHVSIDGADGD